MFPLSGGFKVRYRIVSFEWWIESSVYLNGVVNRVFCTLWGHPGMGPPVHTRMTNTTRLGTREPQRMHPAIIDMPVIVCLSFFKPRCNWMESSTRRSRKYAFLLPTAPLRVPRQYVCRQHGNTERMGERWGEKNTDLMVVRSGGRNIRLGISTNRTFRIDPHLMI